MLVRVGKGGNRPAELVGVEIERPGVEAAQAVQSPGQLVILEFEPAQAGQAAQVGNIPAELIGVEKEGVQAGGQRVGNCPGQGVVVEIEVLQAGQAAQGGNRPGQLIVVEIEVLQAGQAAQGGQVPAEAGVGEPETGQAGGRQLARQPGNSRFPIRRSRVGAQLGVADAELLQGGQGAQVG